MSRCTKREGSIFKRNDGRWCGKYIDEKTGKQRYIYGTTKREVKVRMTQELNEEENQEEKQREQEKDWVFHLWVREYLERYKKYELKPSTYGCYLMLYRTYLMPSSLGQMKLSKIRPHDVQTFYNNMIEQGYNVKSILHVKVLISAPLKQAVRERLITENPDEYTILPKKKRYQVKFLTPEEIQKLVKEAKGDALYPIVITALYTGMRKGEIMGLRWQNVDFEKRRIHVVESLCRISKESEVDGKMYSTYELLEPKNKTSVRYIPMVDLVWDILWKLKADQEKEKEKYKEIYQDFGFVFARFDGTFLNQRQFMEHYHAFLKRYGVTDCRFHDLRHSFASLMLESGVAMKTASELLGHSQISTSMDIYTHVYDQTKQVAVEKFNALIMGTETEN